MRWRQSRPGGLVVASLLVLLLAAMASESRCEDVDSRVARLVLGYETSASDTGLPDTAVLVERQPARIPLLHDAGPLLLAAGGDYLSTRYALGAPGTEYAPAVRELNGLAQTDASRILLKSATAVGTTFCVRKLRSHGRHREARALKYFVVGAQVLVAGWNVRLGIQKRRGL